MYDFSAKYIAYVLGPVIILYKITLKHTQEKQGILIVLNRPV